MTNELLDWLNRIGMVLGFISFLACRPGIYWRAAPLRAWEQSLATGILRLPKTLKLLFVAMSIVAAVIYIVKYLSTLRMGRLPDVPERWLLAFGFMSSAVLLSQIIVEPIVSKLANDNRVRQRALFLGALLFAVSFLLEFIATFQSSSGR